MFACKLWTRQFVFTLVNLTIQESSEPDTVLDLTGCVSRWVPTRQFAQRRFRDATLLGVHRNATSDASRVKQTRKLLCPNISATTSEGSKWRARVPKPGAQILHKRQATVQEPNCYTRKNCFGKTIPHETTRQRNIWRGATQEKLREEGWCEGRWKFSVSGAG